MRLPAGEDCGAVRELVEALRLSREPALDLAFVLRTHGASRGHQDLYIRLPNAGFLPLFGAFREIPATEAPPELTAERRRDGDVADLRAEAGRRRAQRKIAGGGRPQHPAAPDPVS